ncbi:helix-turn-helix transcriptional regulator, partial [Limosilactobacillus fermentum]
MNKTNVSQLRKQHGLTQQELADKSYVTIRTVQRLEAGEDVSLSSLSAIANALSVPISGLFDDIEQKEKEQEILDYSQQ